VYAGLIDAPQTDWEAVERLFEEDRDPSERVRGDDWHPCEDPDWHEVDRVHTLEQRRRWCLALLDQGSYERPRPRWRRADLGVRAGQREPSTTRAAQPVSRGRASPACLPSRPQGGEKCPSTPAVPILG
jgi:hypothetical protein